MSIERPRIRYSRGYSIFLRLVQETEPQEEVELKVEREDFRSLEEAQARFNYHGTYLAISRAHKLSMGVPKEATHCTLTLWDKSEGFELSERTLNLNPA